MMHHCVAKSALVRVPFPSTGCNMTVPPKSTHVDHHEVLPQFIAQTPLPINAWYRPKVNSWPHSHFNVKHNTSMLDLDFKTPPFSFKLLYTAFHYDATQNMFPIPYCPTLSLGHWTMFGGFFCSKPTGLEGRAASRPRCLQHGTN